MPEDRNGLDILNEDECLRLLARGGIGRVGLCDGGIPCVLPVAFGLLDRDVVFATVTGTKLDAAVHRSVMAFEIDHMDPLLPIGWSVLVLGMGSEITAPDEVAQAAAIPFHSWVASNHARYVRIRAYSLSGRRLGRAIARRGDADAPRVLDDAVAARSQLDLGGGTDLDLRQDGVEVVDELTTGR